MKIGNFFRHHWGTTVHKFHVARFMLWFAARLVWRAMVHDLSKYGREESDGFVRVIHKLRGTTYGSEEYKTLLKEIKPAIDAHYRKNSHHPEHYANGAKGMDLADVVEMFCDWRAAVLRHADGDIHKSIETNKKRFELGDVLPEVMHNETGGRPKEEGLQ